jgi:hypothetical protein
METIANMLIIKLFGEKNPFLLKRRAKVHQKF